ncbi:transposase [Nocardia sp. A7]|uniref:transposase n=1 Tax=Nocardia sp. A7 TaxID=2789274 RepID=UPI00397C4094
MDLHGIGPSSAARLLADVGDIHRFRDRNRFASWNGTAPLDASSGEQQRHRLSRAGNRRINRVLHVMAVVQLRNKTAGRAYFDARKSGGKTSMEAMRLLKRQLSNVVFRCMLADQRREEKASPGGHSGTTLHPARPASPRTPALRKSHFPDLPPLSLTTTRQPCLDIKGSHERMASAVVVWVPIAFPPRGRAGRRSRGRSPA